MSNTETNKWNREMGVLQATVKSIHDDVGEIKHNVKKLNGTVAKQQTDIATQDTKFDLHERHHDRQSIKVGGTSGIVGGGIIAALLKLIGI